MIDQYLPNVRSFNPNGDSSAGLNPSYSNISLSLCIILGFKHPNTFSHVGLLGPCFQTGAIMTFHQELRTTFPSSPQFIQPTDQTKGISPFSQSESNIMMNKAWVVPNCEIDHRVIHQVPITPKQQKQASLLQEGRLHPDFLTLTKSTFLISMR